VPCASKLVSAYLFISGLGGIYLVRTIMLYFKYEMVRLRLKAYSQYSATNVNRRKSDLSSIFDYLLGKKQNWIQTKSAAMIMWIGILIVFNVPMIADLISIGTVDRDLDGHCVFRYTNYCLPVLQGILLFCFLTMAYKLKQPQFGDGFYIKAELKIVGILAAMLYIAFMVMKYGVPEVNWPYLGEVITFCVLCVCLLGSIFFPLILTIIHYRTIKALNSIEIPKMHDVKKQLELCLANDQTRTAFTTFCETQFCVENVLFLYEFICDLLIC
jgi:hypothetical protein